MNNGFLARFERYKYRAFMSKGFVAGTLILMALLILFLISGCFTAVISDSSRPIYRDRIYTPPPRVHCETKWRYNRWQGRMVPYEHCARY